MKRRSNRFLTWAIAISLATHVVFIYWGQGMNLGAADPLPPPQYVHFDHPRPTPPPPTVIVTPKPVVPTRPQQTTQQHPPTPPKSHNNDNTTTTVPPGAIAPPGLPDVGPGDVGPIGPVEPTATPAPSCSAPDVAAHVLNTATAETPEVAQEQGITGTTQVEVSIDPDGKITATSIYRSSGSQALDNAALAAARQSTYRADVRDCEAVAGSYLFTVVFQ